ncbi:MAG: GNAT family N-acetyltransferase [Clostridiales bacterium]|jgi:GNAT superfamily N-acetyltransferase|nr:GNAT family N-acetyltransferase [Clostridiales bacterium]
MRVTQKALDYLNRDFLSNCSLIQVINRKSGEIIKADSQGVLLYDCLGEAHMLSARYNENTRKWFDNLDCDLIQLVGGDFVSWLMKRFNLNHAMECIQYVYTGQKPPEYEKRLEISFPTDEEMYVIRKNYDKLSDEELWKIRDTGNLYAARDGNNNFVGFVGSHLEGSMGLLGVLPEYQRKGYGHELECFIIGRFLEKGLIPYGQVVSGNERSENLQSKLKLTKASSIVYWLY